MLAGIIIGGIFLLFFLLLLCPIRLAAHYDGEFYARVRYLFLSFTLAPPKPKPAQESKRKPKKAKPQKPGPKPSSRIRGILKSWGLGGILSFLGQLARLAAGTGKRLFSHLVITRLTFSLRIGGSDAAAVATQYGRACAGLYPAFAVLTGNTKCRRHQVWVAPDFTAEKTEFSFEVRLFIRPLFVLTAVLGFVCRAVRLYLRRRPRPAPLPDSPETDAA